MGDSTLLLRGVQTLRTEFLKTVKEAPKTYLKHMMFLRSSSASETHLFGSTAPKVREWVDERKPGGLHAKTWDVQNKRLENSLSVDVPSLERDSIGFHVTKIQELGIRMANYPLTMLSRLRMNGTTDLCWDGQPFFDTDHEWRGSGQQSNKLSQTGTTIDNVSTDFYKCVEKRVGWKDDQGEVDDLAYQLMKPTIVFGPAMLAVMTARFATETLSSGGKNPLYNAAELVVDPRITGNGFIFEDLGHPTKPYGLQEEIPLRMENTKIGSDEVFNRGVVKFGTEWRGAEFYGDPSLAILVGSLSS